MRNNTDYFFECYEKCNNQINFMFFGKVNTRLNIPYYESRKFLNLKLSLQKLFQEQLSFTNLYMQENEHVFDNTATKSNFIINHLCQPIPILDSDCPITSHKFFIEPCYVRTGFEFLSSSTFLSPEDTGK